MRNEEMGGEVGVWGGEVWECGRTGRWGEVGGGGRGEGGREGGGVGGGKKYKGPRIHCTVVRQNISTIIDWTYNEA